MSIDELRMITMDLGDFHVKLMGLTGKQVAEYALSVPCDTCGAQVWKPCRKQDGRDVCKYRFVYAVKYLADAAERAVKFQLEWADGELHPETPEDEPYSPPRRTSKPARTYTDADWQ